MASQSAISDELLDFKNWIQSQIGNEVGGNAFMSPAVLGDYLNTSRLKAILDQIEYSTKIPIDFDTVKRECKAILAILTLCEEPRFISYFTKQPHRHDASLPFATMPSNFPSSTLWSNFDKYQWQFCPHNFYGQVNMELDGRTILPFMSKDNRVLGGTAEVSRVQIHKDFNHLEPQTADHKYYALKTFRQNGPKAKVLYKAETAAFQYLSKSGARPAINNIIAFYGGFVQNDTYYILLEYAEHGTLEEFFQTRPPLQGGQDLIPLWESMSGLAAAVSTIHELSRDPELASETKKLTFRGWHQDVKPANILVLSDPKYRSRYIFKLADFALSHFRSFTASQEQLAGGEILDRDARGTREYGAPECYRGFAFVHNVSRWVDQKPDVWSLGAVYSEMAIWSVLGKSGLAEYRHARKEATEAVLNHEDIGCFHDKEKRLSCVDGAHLRAAQEIKKTDNITEPILSQLLPYMLCDQKGRFNASQLHYNFELIIKKAKESQQPGILRPQTEPAMPVDGTSRANHMGLSLRPLSKIPDPDIESVDMEIGDQTAPDSTPVSESSLQQQDPFSIPGGANSFPGRACRSPCLSLHQEPDGVIELPRTNTALGSQANTSRFPTNTMPQITLAEVEERMEQEEKLRTFGRLGRKKFTALLAEVDTNSKIRNLNGRDHVFLVDDSVSMNKHWPELKRLLKVLAWLVSRDDTNGMELKFLISNKCCTSKDPAKLVDYLAKGKRLGESDINERLGEVLEDYCSEVNTWKKSQIRSSLKLYQSLLGKGKPKKLSIYVLTNAVWQPKSDPAKSIKQMVKKLEEWEFPCTNRVGIQFIRFGEDPDCIQKLNRLDLKSQLGVSIDIVDHEPSTGNPLKMIIGPIDKHADGDDDDDLASEGAAVLNVLTKDQLS